MRAVLFAGQGSQRRGMGAALFARFPYLVSLADEVLGWSVAATCVEDPEGKLGRTEYTQPALFVVQALSWLAACEQGGDLPAFAAGHSVGEYAALFAAGVVDFETCLRIVRARGQLMGRANGGGMAAVLGVRIDAVRETLAAHALRGVEIANLNTPLQTVVAGEPGALERARIAFEGVRGATWMPLAVSAAFHSSHMLEASRDFQAYLAEVHLGAPRFPVLSTATARPHDADPRAALAAQIHSAVRWTECVEFLLGQGVTEFVELGESKILAGMLRQIRAGRAA